MSLLFDEPHIIHQPPLSLRKIAELNLNNQQIIGTHTYKIYLQNAPQVLKLWTQIIQPSVAGLMIFGHQYRHHISTKFNTKQGIDPSNYKHINIRKSSSCLSVIVIH